MQIPRFSSADVQQAITLNIHGPLSVLGILLPHWPCAVYFYSTNRRQSSKAETIEKACGLLQTTAVRQCRCGSCISFHSVWSGGRGRRRCILKMSLPAASTAWHQQVATAVCLTRTVRSHNWGGVTDCCHSLSLQAKSRFVWLLHHVGCWPHVFYTNAACLYSPEHLVGSSFCFACSVCVWSRTKHLVQDNFPSGQLSSDQFGSNYVTSLGRGCTCTATEQLLVWGLWATLF